MDVSLRLKRYSKVECSVLIKSDRSETCRLGGGDGEAWGEAGRRRPTPPYEFNIPKLQNSAQTQQ